MASITPDTADELKATIDSYISKPNGIPGMVCSFINKDGDTVFEYAAGKRGIGSAEPMTTDTIFWIASCTKLITAVAAMQLVEQHKVDLDNGQQTEDILHELKSIKVIEEMADGKLRLVDKKRQITLRMLLSHTAGFSYSFHSLKLKKWFEPIGIMEDSTVEEDIFGQPLVNQPGEKWEYGVNMDWVGRLVERVSGLTLDEYFHEHIFKPLNMSSPCFFPQADQKKKLAFLHQRNSDGTIAARENGHLLHRPLSSLTPKEAKGIPQSGGAGLFSVVSDYCEIIATILNYGKHPKTGWQLLKEATLKEMFTNQVPQFPDFARNLEPTVKPSFVYSASEIYPQAQNPPQGWGLSFFTLLHPGPTGRSANTVFWTGLANLVWWADVENGIGGIMASQILPFGDSDFFNCHAEVEAQLYAALPKSSIIATVESTREDK